MARYTVHDEQLDARARSLRARYLGGGVFMVQSGSQAGQEYQVDADPNCHGEAAPLAEWRCGCFWGTAGDYAAPGAGHLCSHVRAAGQLLALAQELAPLATYASRSPELAVAR
jgi:hypothetical protein